MLMFYGLARDCSELCYPFGVQSQAHPPGKSDNLLKSVLLRK